MLRPVLDSEKSGSEADDAERTTKDAKATLRFAAPSIVLGVLVLASFGYTLPKMPRNPLIETTLWSLVVVACFAGWGSLVKLWVAPRERVDLGLRVAWGASALCFVAGVLMTVAAMGRTTALVIVDAGVILAVISLARERKAVRTSARFALRVARREPRLAVLGALIFALFVLQYLGGIADWHTNPYDDDIAYLAFMKKLLDTGTVLEPFSLRRLSALGGQTFFLELVALRAAPTQAHTFDRSICMLMVVLLLVGHKHRGRRVPLLLTCTTVLLFVTLQNVAINTASYYSGVAFFLALFRTMVWADVNPGRDVVKTAAPIALIGGALCTLRQNYIAVPPLVLGASYVFRSLGMKGRSWRERLAEPLICGGLSVVTLVPWFIQGWQSNRTFFYPVMLGTSNPAMLLTSSATTPLREIQTFLWTLLEGMNLRLIAIFALAAAFVREKSARRPLWSLFLGSFAGVALLVHGLSQGDAGNIGRYAFGYVVAFAFAVVITVGTTPMTGAGLPKRELWRARIAGGVTVIAILAQLVDSHRNTLYISFTKSFRNVENLWNSTARKESTTPFIARVYSALQGSVPQGERLAVMLDEPHYLDFARNPIWNLDMPGYSSLPPGIPYFAGPERVEQYFRDKGVRYIAFVRPGFSRYHYRRDYWIEMLLDEQEMWRAHAPYLIDFYDNLVRLDMKHGRIFDDQGMSVIDLEKTP